MATLSEAERIELGGYLVELRRVYFSGASRVKYKERDTTFRSSAELLAAIKQLEADLATNTTVKTGVGFAEFGTGL